MVERRGKVVTTNRVDLQSGHIANIWANYLGIPQSHNNHEEETRKIT